MVKLKNPLFSFSASRKIGDITLRRIKKVHIAEKTPLPKDAKSTAQLSWRHMYQKAVALWNALSGVEKQEWESLARPKHMTGFAYFISSALKPNPGLYLPLQGGSMQGDIDMATHAITDLPDPTDNQDPVTKKYLEDTYPPGYSGEGHISIWLWDYDSIGQGTWAYVVDSTLLLNGYWKNTTAANGDNINYRVYLAAGTYTLRLLLVTHSDSPIIDFDIDADEVASWDQYTAVLTRNVLKTQTGIVVATSGLKTLKWRIDGKNPASGSHESIMQDIALWRTS